MSRPSRVLSSACRAKSLGSTLLSCRVVAFDAGHGVIHELADGAMLDLRLQMRPTCLGRHPEDVLRAVLIRVLKVVALRLFGLKNSVLFLEGIGDVLEKNNAEDDVLVFGGIHAAAQCVSQSWALYPTLAAMPGPRALVRSDFSVVRAA